VYACDYTPPRPIAFFFDFSRREKERDRHREKRPPKPAKETTKKERERERDDSSYSSYFLLTVKERNKGTFNKRAKSYPSDVQGGAVF
tara:strand:- start:79 stop:342 length:264 start_codon:yes stop_codon:yes gene_type:complete